MTPTGAMCRWESVPLKVQREIIMRADVEMKVFHPRLMGAKEFDSVELEFLNKKPFPVCGYQHAAKLDDPDRKADYRRFYSTL